MEPDLPSRALPAYPDPDFARPPAGYSRLQVVLHWIVAGLVFMQWTTSDAVHRTHDLLRAPSPEDLRTYAFHTYGGIAIGILMAWRLLLWWRRGVPAAPPGEPRWRARIAGLVHGGLYAALLAQAATGITAGYIWAGAGRFHATIWNVVLALVAAHLLGVFHHALRRDGAALRMTRFGEG